MFFLVLLAAGASAESALHPEGYSERWQRLVDGWVWRPLPGDQAEPLRGKDADDGVVSIAPGEWWFAEARDFESFRVVPTEGEQPAGSALEIYAVTRGSVDVGPRPDHLGMPPPRTALLAARLPWRERSGEARAELAPGDVADWIGVRCVAKNVALYRFSLDGYEQVTQDESWERVERGVRLSGAGDPWPVPSDPATLPGHDIGRFLRGQRVLLPWGPGDDSPEERQLRSVAWCAGDLRSRHPVWWHARTHEWDEGGLPRFKDKVGRPWLRATKRTQVDVKGPGMLRVIARTCVSVKTGEDLPNLAVDVSVGDATWTLRGYPAADVEETSRAWDGDDFLAGGAPPERWMVSSPREIRVPVPPGLWTVTISSRREVYTLVQELEAIEQAEFRSPFRSLPSFEATDARSAAARAVERELLGDWRGVLEALATVPVEEPGELVSAADVNDRAWFLWKRLEIAMRVRNAAEADEAAPRLARLLPFVRGDLASEVRLELLRYAVRTRRDGMAAQVSQWIYDDPPAEPEDFVEALSAWCIGRRPLERMRAWPVSARPDVLRRFLKNVEARSIREVFGTWGELGTLGTTAGGRRWIVPIVAQVADRPLRGDALSAWLNGRSASGSGPWYLARAGDFRAVATGEGFLQVLPAADWLPPVSLDVAPAADPEHTYGRLRFRDAHNLGLLALSGAAPGTALAARPAENTERVYLFKGQNVVFGDASLERRSDSRIAPVPEAVRRTGDVTERWGIVTDLFPLQAPAGSTPSVDFRGENYLRAGIVRYRFGVASRADRATNDLEVPFTLYVGPRELPVRRLLWISKVEGETGDRESAPGPPVETYAPGPVVSGSVLVGPGPALVRIESPLPWETYGAAAELDVAATPADVLIRRAEGSDRPAPPSGMWEAPLGVTGDPKEAADTAEATRAIADAADDLARAAALEARARLMFRMGRNQAVPDLEEAEALFPEGSLDRDRISLALAVYAFRAGDDLELRARVEGIIRAGGRSREVFLLAAAAALGTDNLAAARAWFEQARREPDDASVDLERFIAAALDAPMPSGEAADPLMGVMTDLLRLRRLDPTTEVAPALLRIAERCEGEALNAASHYLFARGARFADWAVQARQLAPYAGTSDWPPPRGVLAPMERARDLRREEVLSTPPVVRLAGRYGAWESAWMTAGDELALSLPGPEVYEFVWRSAHAVENGEVRRDVAPSRIIVDGLPGIASHDVLANDPAPGVTCERLPWAWPGEGDSWRAMAPAGQSRVRVRVTAGSGFLTVRRVAGPVWMAWDARTGMQPAAQPYPPPLDLPQFSPDPKAPLLADIRRRLDAARKAGPSPRFGRGEYTEALTSLADDLLYAVMTRAQGSEPEWVVRALDLYGKAHADGLGNEHWQRHNGLALLLTRWTVLDLSADLPEFRRVRISRDVPDNPAVAVSEALFFPFPDDTASVLFDSDDLVEWHHRSDADLPLHVDIVAVPWPVSDAPLVYELRRDGLVVASGDLAAGKRVTLPAGAAKEALVSIRIGSTRPLARARGRARLLVETPDGLRPVRPERNVVLYRAAAGTREFVVRGPTLARMETWDATDLKATDDPSLWLAQPAPIAKTVYQGVPRPGASAAIFTLDHDAFVRLSVRTVDGQALARLALPSPAVGEIASEAEAPPAPDVVPDPAPGRRESWRLVEYPGMVSVFTEGFLRDAGSEDFKEDTERNEIRAGVTVHWKAFETRIYTQAQFYVSKTAGFVPIQVANVRFHHYFLDDPDLDYRILVQFAGEPLRGYYAHSWETDARLRWRWQFDEQWILYVQGHFNYWWSSLEDEDTAGKPAHRLIHNDYRDNNFRWLQFEARLRAMPWQNVYVDMFAGTRSHPDLRSWDPERYTYGVRAGAHYEDFFADLTADRIYRLDDQFRARTGSERRIALDLGWEHWLGAGVWVGAGAGFRWSPDTHGRQAYLGLTFRFGGSSGDRLDHVDPEFVEFLHYQQAGSPWQP